MRRFLLLLFFLTLSTSLFTGLSLYPYVMHGLRVELQRTTGPDMIVIDAPDAFYETLGISHDTFVQLYCNPETDTFYPLPQGDQQSIIYGTVHPSPTIGEEAIYRFDLEGMQEKYIVDLLQVLFVISAIGLVLTGISMKRVIRK